jgi:broad specificity phosphatase PhoE
VTRILLVRHGQSEFNASGRWQGQADPPLSELGCRQAEAAAARLGAVDLIVSSDLERAAHTAQILSGALGVGPVVVEARLRERDAGEWSGLTHDEIEQAWPGYLEARRRPPGFESDEDLLARVDDALAAIEDAYRGAEVLVVAHGGIVYALENRHGLGFERLPNLGARWLTHHGDRIELGDRLLLVDHELLTSVPTQI